MPLQHRNGAPTISPEFRYSGKKRVAQGDSLPIEPGQIVVIVSDHGDTCTVKDYSGALGTVNRDDLIPHTQGQRLDSKTAARLHHASSEHTLDV
jgi:hypothetical protein